MLRPAVADTTEQNTAERVQKFPLNRCCGPPLPVGGLLPLQGQHMGTNLLSQRAVTNTNTKVNGFLKNN